MTESLATGNTEVRTKMEVIDCDIHNLLPSTDALKPFLSSRWRTYLDRVGLRGSQGFLKGTQYPKISAATARSDAWPSSGMLPGSDLDFMREQHLDALNIEYGILNCLERVGDQLNLEWAAAMASAVNDWQIAEWLEKDSRLRASIVVPHEHGEFAAAEIDRVAKHDGFVQVLVLGRTREPLGRQKYWKIYEAAERHGLPIGIHVSDNTGNPITPSGWPSYYLEDHVLVSQALQAQIISLVCEGVFEKFPSLRIVAIESGFAWVPSLMWRLDKHWNLLHNEVPHLRRPPSEYIREHVWFTTQPMDEPHTSKQFFQTLKHFESDPPLMFATDYPHWDFDAPHRAFPVKLPSELKQKVFVDNARSVYRLDV